MSDLTKRLRDRIISASLRNDKTGALEMREIRDPLCVEAADRIEALEECLRNYMSQFGQALDAHGIPYGEEQDKADKQARALLEEK